MRTVPDTEICQPDSHIWPWCSDYCQCGRWFESDDGILYDLEDE